MILAEVSCGNETLFIGCHQCPKDNDQTFNTWCSGNCYYDVKLEICKEGRRWVYIVCNYVISRNDNIITRNIPIYSNRYAINFR